MLTDAQQLKNFKKNRANHKKKAISGTVVKDRLDNIMDGLSGKFYAFSYLNETEKLDFMLLMTETLMTSSGWFPGMKTMDQIHADEAAKKFFNANGKWPADYKPEETASAAS